MGIDIIDCRNLIILYNKINVEGIKSTEYLGSGKYSTTILYNKYAYKIYPIVCEGEEKGLSSNQHKDLILQEIGWQTIASTTSEKFNMKLSPTIYDYIIFSDDTLCKDRKKNKTYFIIKMEYLKDYVDVDTFANLHPDLFLSRFFQEKIIKLVKEKNKRNIPNISDGSPNLLLGVQALVNIKKVIAKKDDCVYLIDFGNVMDYKNEMEKLLEKYDPLQIPNDVLVRPLSHVNEKESDINEKESDVNKKEEQIFKYDSRIRITRSISRGRLKSRPSSRPSSRPITSSRTRKRQKK